MYRVGIVKTDGDIISQNFKTKSECDEWILLQTEECEVKKAIISNKETNEREIINF